MHTFLWSVNSTYSSKRVALQIMTWNQDAVQRNQLITNSRNFLHNAHCSYSSFHFSAHTTSIKSLQVFQTNLRRTRCVFAPQRESADCMQAVPNQQQRHRAWACSHLTTRVGIAGTDRIIQRVMIQTGFTTNKLQIKVRTIVHFILI